MHGDNILDVVAETIGEHLLLGNNDGYVYWQKFKLSAQPWTPENPVYHRSSPQGYIPLLDSYESD